MNNKGFVFVETMIVTTVLIASLLVIYISYQNIIAKNNKLTRYDDSAFIYKTAVIKDFLIELRNSDGDLLIEKIKSELNKKEKKIFYINPQVNELFNSNMHFYETKKSFFSSLYSQYNINSLYIINNSMIDDINEKDYPNIKKDEKTYLNRLYENNGNKWFLVAIYSEKLNQEGCKVNNMKTNNINDLSETSCIYYYSSLEI